MRYFAYGMNMASQYMTDAKLLGLGLLSGWELRFAYYADIQPAEGATVPGVLWEIDDEILRSLDSREGYRPDNHPEWNMYRRLEVPVELSATGEVSTAWVYTMNGARGIGKDGHTAPDSHYYNLCADALGRHGGSIAHLERALEACHE